MAELKKLVFGEGLMGPTIAGDKKITLRKYRAGAHDFTKGLLILGIFKDGLNIVLCITKDTEKKPFSKMTYEEARLDGFADVEDAFNNLRDYYPDLKKTDILATIRYEVAEIASSPAVSFNEYAQ